LAVERGRSVNTITSYRRDLRAYEATLSRRSTTPSRARTEDVLAHAEAVRASGASPATLARTLSVVRGLHRFMADEEMAPVDPTVDLAGPSVPGRLPKALSESEVDRLLAAAAGDTALARRDRALLEVLYATGGRISEVVGLDLADLAPGDGMLRLYGKGSKERLVPLGRCATEALDRWLAPEGRGALAPKQWRRRGDAEAVFLNARGGRLGRQGAFAVVRTRARQAGLEAKVSPHVLRHSCATHMLARGADVRVVQELLGHASVTTTQLYTKVTTEHLRGAYESAHPRAAGHRDQAEPAGASRI
jgi:integrase/recombinase XerD